MTVEQAEEEFVDGTVVIERAEFEDDEEAPVSNEPSWRFRSLRTSRPRAAGDQGSSGDLIDLHEVQADNDSRKCIVRGSHEAITVTLVMAAIARFHRVQQYRARASSHGAEGGEVGGGRFRGYVGGQQPADILSQLKRAGSGSGRPLVGMLNCAASSARPPPFARQTCSASK